jgi:hypothetical protein
VTQRSIDDYIKQRNEIQLAAEEKGNGDSCWIRLGPANRHIERVLAGSALTPAVEREIQNCFDRLIDTGDAIK